MLINTYVQNSKASNDMKQTLTELKREIVKIIVDFNTLLLIMDRSIRRSISKGLEQHYRQLNLIDIYRRFHPIRAE